MRIDSAAFVASLAAPADFPGIGKPEIAFVGRSNVGKSSMINALANRKSLARASSEPGKTRTVNLYEVNGAFLFTDLPGYGYAKVSKSEKKLWDDRAGGYLESCGRIRLAFLIVDIRRDPTPDDSRTAAYLRHIGIPYAVIASKADKISKAARANRISAIGRALGAQPWEIIPFSSVSRLGVENALERIEACLGE